MKKIISKKILIGLILIILIAIGIIIWAYWIKPEDGELLIIEEPFEQGLVIEEKPSCFNSSQTLILICNCEDLQRIGEDLSADYRLENDINCSQTENWNEGKGFNPLGSDQSNLFSGTLDGQNHIIVNLFINRSDQVFVGLFGYLQGEITNLGLENVNIKGNNSTGALVGSNLGGTITDSYVAGIVFGNDDTGGLVGRNGKDAKVINSYSLATVFNGGKDVGGLVGENEGIIMNSYATGSVSSKKGTGGLVGENEGTVKNSYATGDVAGDENVGGFVGDNEGLITNSYATGTISGNKDVGGFMGDNHGGTVENSFSTGEAIGFDRIGGFNGVNHEGNIINSYWNKPTGSSLSGVGSIKKGDVEYFTIENNENYFYDTNNAPLNLWEFPPWSRENNNKDYPVLESGSEEIVELPLPSPLPSSQPPPPSPSPPPPSSPPPPPPPPPSPSPSPPPPGEQEEEEEEGIISIYNCENLQAIQQGLSASYKLQNNIDCSETKNWNNGKGFKPIGYDSNSGASGHQGNKFTGNFDGQGYLITNLFIKRPNEDNIGLFGYSEGTIKNVGLINIDFSGREEVGGVGKNGGIITTMYTTGKVSGYEDAGGLVGENTRPIGDISNSYSFATLYNSIEDVGGLVGENEATIRDCYAAGDVAGGKNIGGLVGDNEGTITNCYAVGVVSGTSDVGGLVGDSIGTITNSYWNKPAGSSLDCVGKIKSGTVDCYTIQNQKSYFYGLDNAPMNVWKFPPWDRKNNSKDYPVLE